MSEERIAESSDETVASTDFQTAPMDITSAADKPRRRGGGLSAAVLFIGFGVLLLLNNLGILDVNLLSLLRYWPVLLIIVGLDLILGRQGIMGSVVMAAISLALVAGVIVLSLTGALGPALGGRLTGDFSETAGASALNARIELGIMEANISALDGDAYLFDGSYSTPEDLPITVDYSRDGDTGMLVIQQVDIDRGPSIPFLNGGNSLSGDFTLGLQQDIPIALTVSVGIGDTTLDLTDLTLTSLDVEGGIGSLEIILPAAGDFDGNFDVGIGDMQIRLPQSMAAHINYEGGIVSLDTVSRLERVGEGVWETDDYDGADNRIELNIDAGIGNVDIRDR